MSQVKVCLALEKASQAAWKPSSGVFPLCALFRHLSPSAKCKI